MGMQKPWDRGSDELSYTFLSDESHTEMGRILPELYLATIKEGGYMAIGGYQDIGVQMLQDSLHVVSENEYDLDGLFVQLYFRDSKEVRLVIDAFKLQGVDLEFFDLGELDAFNKANNGQASIENESGH